MIDMENGPGDEEPRQLPFWGSNVIPSSPTLWVSVSLVLVVAAKPTLQNAIRADLYCILFCFFVHPVQAILSFFTSTLGHQGWGHLAVNLPIVVLVGWPLERVVGPRRWLAVFFLAGGLGSLIGYLITDGTSIGASGAAAAFLAMGLVSLVPRAGSVLGFHNAAQRAWTSAAALSAVLLFLGLLWIALTKDSVEHGHWAHVVGYTVGLLAAVHWETIRQDSPWHLLRKTFPH